MERQDFINLLDTFADRVRSFAWSDVDCYASWLSQTYHFACHNTRLIALGASRFYQSKNELYHRFVDHLGEEKNHERLALRDLKALKRKLEQYPQLAITKGLYQSQYYQIERLSPDSFFGYILALEGIACYAGESALEQVTAAFGNKAATFIRVHSQEDKEHFESAVTHALNTTPSELESIFENFKQSGELYCLMLDAIEEQYLSNKDEELKAA